MSISVSVWTWAALYSRQRPLQLEMYSYYYRYQAANAKRATLTNRRRFRYYNGCYRYGNRVYHRPHCIHYCYVVDIVVYILTILKIDLLVVDDLVAKVTSSATCLTWREAVARSVQFTFLSVIY